jgi:hypothetical protein
LYSIFVSGGVVEIRMGGEEGRWEGWKEGERVEEK